MVTWRGAVVLSLDLFQRCMVRHRLDDADPTFMCAASTAQTDSSWLIKTDKDHIKGIHCMGY